MENTQRVWIMYTSILSLCFLTVDEVATERHFIVCTTKITQLYILKVSVLELLQTVREGCPPRLLCPAKVSIAIDRENKIFLSSMKEIHLSNLPIYKFSLT